MIRLLQNTANYLEIPVNLPGVPAILELTSTVTRQTQEFRLDNLSRVPELYLFKLELGKVTGEYEYQVKTLDDTILATGIAKVTTTEPTLDVTTYNPDTEFAYYDNC